MSFLSDFLTGLSQASNQLPASIETRLRLQQRAQELEAERQRFEQQQRRTAFYKQLEGVLATGDPAMIGQMYDQGIELGIFNDIGRSPITGMPETKAVKKEAPVDQIFPLPSPGRESVLQKLPAGPVPFPGRESVLQKLPAGPVPFPGRESVLQKLPYPSESPPDKGGSLRALLIERLTGQAPEGQSPPTVPPMASNLGQSMFNRQQQLESERMQDRLDQRRKTESDLLTAQQNRIHQDRTYDLQVRKDLRDAAIFQWQQDQADKEAVLKQLALEAKGQELDQERNRRPLSNIQANSIKEVRSTFTLLQELRQTIRAHPEYVGKRGTAGQWVPTSIWPDVAPPRQTLESKFQLFRQRLGKTEEGGVLHKDDIPKYLAIIGDAGDNSVFLTENLGQLSSMLAKDIALWFETQHASGFDVRDQLKLLDLRDMGLGAKDGVPYDLFGWGWVPKGQEKPLFDAAADGDIRAQLELYRRGIYGRD